MKALIVLSTVVFSLFLTGCSMTKTYEVFEKNRNFNIGGSMEWWTKYAKLKEQNDEELSYTRQGYDKNSYIYIYKGDGDLIDDRCVYGYITDKDDPKQIKKQWVILSEKKYCKQRQTYGCCM